jgi:hypothetical protein
VNVFEVLGGGLAMGLLLATYLIIVFDDPADED